MARTSFQLAVFRCNKENKPQYCTEILALVSVGILRCPSTSINHNISFLIVNVALAWIMVGSLFLVFAIMIKQVFISWGEDQDDIVVASSSLISIYMALLLTTFVISVGVDVGRAEQFYQFLMWAFALYMLFSLVLVFVFIGNMSMEFDFLPVIVGTSVFIFVVTIMVHCAWYQILRGIFQFIVMTPTYVNIILIYSNCNIHDCTWGNRPDTLSKGEQTKESEFKAYRTKWLLIWVLSNSAFAYIFYTLSQKGKPTFVIAVLLIGFVVLCIRGVGSIAYWIQEKRKGSKQLESDSFFDNSESELSSPVSIGSFQEQNQLADPENNLQNESLYPEAQNDAEIYTGDPPPSRDRNESGSQNLDESSFDQEIYISKMKPKSCSRPEEETKSQIDARNL